MEPAGRKANAGRQDKPAGPQHTEPPGISRVQPGQYLDGRPPGKTRLLLEEVLVRPAGGAHPVVCVSPNAPV